MDILLADSDLLLPSRSPVTPRGRVLPNGEILPIEDLVRPFIEAGARGAIAIQGERDSGRSVAIAQLGAVFGDREEVLLLDGPLPMNFQKEQLLVIYTTRKAEPGATLARIAISGWGIDEAIEYLLSMHKHRCASVMKRILGDEDRATVLGNSPRLWKCVLDEMAADETLPDAASSILRRFERLVPDESLRRRIGKGEFGSPVLPKGPSGAPGNPFLMGEAWTLLHHRSVRILIGAEALFRDLKEGSLGNSLDRPLPADLILRIASLAHRANRRDVVCAALTDVIQRARLIAHSAAASLLFAIDPDWRPCENPSPRLAWARLPRVRWHAIKLHWAEFEGADLAGADLREADLVDADLTSTGLQEADLAHANLDRVQAHRADFSGSNLIFARLNEAKLSLASFQGAQLSGCMLREANLRDANLSQADFSEADLGKALLMRSSFEGANLWRTNLRRVLADSCDFRKARLYRPVFSAARLRGCNFEGLSIESPDFDSAFLSGALFTDTVLTDARFKDALLRMAGLSGISWPGADLRNADLTYASFHLGSSRCGHVGSPIASEGSRTGFYTDEYHEQVFKSPEEVRVANLCGADLRGAHVLGADFYLVDLRGAKYSEAQRRHFARCRAILDDWNGPDSGD